MSSAHDAPSGVYSIKQVAALAGVPSTTLRAWERRYGVPVPQRSTNRYRLYQPAELDEILRMRDLVKQGAAPRLAAEQVKFDRAGGQVLDPARFVARLVHTHMHDDERSAQVRAGLASAPLQDSIESWLMPMLRRVGTEWAAGRLTITDEHALASTVMRRLGVLYEEAQPPVDGPRVLVGLAEGCHHQIGPLAFSVLARRAGLQVSYLGGNLPVDAWLSAVARFGPVAVVTAAHRPEDVAAVDGLLQTFRAAHPGLVVAVGGGSQAKVPGGALRLGHKFQPGVERLLRRLPR